MKLDSIELEIDGEWTEIEIPHVNGGIDWDWVEAQPPAVAAEIESVLDLHMQMEAEDQHTRRQESGWGSD